MALDLEIVGEVRDLTEADTSVNAPVSLKRLRDSHHAVARLLAKGLTPAQVSLQTGYALSRISVLQRDPTFRELMTFYRRDEDAARIEYEAQMELVSRDYLQAIHEDLHDDVQMTTMEKAEIWKLVTDRAGFAPISRSVNKNLNLNIGDRMDAVKARMKRDAA
jgi:hypothetical protein